MTMGFSRQEYWSKLPCPPPGDLPNLGIELESLLPPALAGRFFTTSITWKAPASSSGTHLLRCVIRGLPRCLSSKESTCNAGDSGLNPGSVRSPGGGHSNPLQYGLQSRGSERVRHSWRDWACTHIIKNPVDTRTWWDTVHGVANSLTWLSDWTELNWTELNVQS